MCAIVFDVLKNNCSLFSGWTDSFFKETMYTGEQMKHRVLSNCQKVIKKFQGLEICCGNWNKKDRQNKAK